MNNSIFNVIDEKNQLYMYITSVNKNTNCVDTNLSIYNNLSNLGIRII